MMRLLSLCTGIGGGDLAAEWTGHIQLIGQVENDPYCCAVLQDRWPNVPRKRNIQDVTGDEFGAVDLVLAGFPCQPHSLAGQRQASADERDLWPDVKRIIARAQPRWIV
jgi:DNA (cytosine-5)-methyltransferase 1